MSLIQKLESGNAVTRDDLNRVATLQVLDAVLSDRQFVNDNIQRDRDQINVFSDAQSNIATSGG